MTRKNWRFWTYSAIFFTAHNFLGHDKTRIIFDAKIIMEKYSSVFLQEFCSEKWALHCHALLGGPARLKSYEKLVWTIALSIQKGSCKNFQLVSYNNFLNKQGFLMGAPITTPTEQIYI